MHGTPKWDGDVEKELKPSRPFRPEVLFDESDNKPLPVMTKWNFSKFPNGHKCPFGCNGYITAVDVGQSQPLYSGVGIFNWCYLSSPGVHLESGGLMYSNGHYPTDTSTRSFVTVM